MIATRDLLEELTDAEGFALGLYDTVSSRYSCVMEKAPREAAIFDELVEQVRGAVAEGTATAADVDALAQAGHSFAGEAHEAGVAFGVAAERLRQALRGPERSTQS